jgi:micrococcal nuclease
MHYLCFICICICTPLLALAASYPAELVRVIDGDTVVLMWNNQQNTVRIIGIDTPEVAGPYTTAECWGKESSSYAASLLPDHQPLDLEFTNQYDQYDRALGYITLTDGRDFGYHMIHSGHAFAYRAYEHPQRSAYLRAEQSARADSRGLWQDSACAQSTQAQEQMKILWSERIAFVQSMIEYIVSLLR